MGMNQPNKYPFLWYLLKWIEQYKDNLLQSALEKIVDKGATEITISIHSAAADRDSSKTLGYLTSTREYLKWCKESGVPILHFRAMASLDGTIGQSLEQSLLGKFGVEADYEIAAISGMGIPLDLAAEYFRQEQNGPYNPAFVMPNNKIQIVNGIGCFSGPKTSFSNGAKIMAGIALNEVRLIGNCILPWTEELRPHSIEDYVGRYKFRPDIKISLYSFENLALNPLSETR